MSLRTRIAESLNNIAKSLVGGVDNSDSAFAFNQLFGNYADTRKLGKYKGIVFAAVNLISDEVGDYQPYLNKRQVDGHLEPLSTHPFLELIANPQVGVSQFDLFKATQTYIDILGESFWYIPIGSLTGKPNISKGSEIYLLPPDKMGLKIDDTGEVIGYCLRKANGTETLFKAEEIGHIKTFNPNNPYRGYGIVEAAIDYIETEESTRLFTKNFFKNNASPAGIISVKGDISKENFKIFSRKWREQYEGTKNAGKTALIRQSEISFTKTSLGLDEIDMQALKDLTVGEVLRMFRVPKALLGEETGQGFGRASVETLEYIFAKRTIEPKMDLIDNFLQTLVKRYYPTEQLTVTHENIIPADKTFELEERKAGVDTWLTRNEIRQEYGLEDAEGGEKLRVLFNSMPLDEETTSEPISPQIEEAKGHITITKTVKKKNLDVEVKENFRLSLLRKQRLYERRFKKALAPVLEDQKAEVLRNWRKINAKGTKGVVKAVEDGLIDLREAEKAFEASLLPIELNLADEQGQLALEFAGADELEFELTPQVQKYIKDALHKMQYRFNDETIKSLGSIIVDGLQEGKSVKAIAKELSGFYDSDVRGWRAERLSRTETLRASNAATRMAYKQTGFVTYMVWYANPDACAFCAELDGTKVGLDENFANLGDELSVGDALLDINYTNIENPPLHPNCECGIIPSRE